MLPFLERSTDGDATYEVGNLINYRLQLTCIRRRCIFEQLSELERWRDTLLSCKFCFNESTEFRCGSPVRWSETLFVQRTLEGVGCNGASHCSSPITSATRLWHAGRSGSTLRAHCGLTEPTLESMRVQRGPLASENWMLPSRQNERNSGVRCSCLNR